MALCGDEHAAQLGYIGLVLASVGPARKPVHAIRDDAVRGGEAAWHADGEHGRGGWRHAYLVQHDLFGQRRADAVVKQGTTAQLDGVQTDRPHADDFDGHALVGRIARDAVQE